MAERVLHLLLWTKYEVLGVAELQRALTPVKEGSKLAIYRGDDGKLWAKDLGDSHDGRFTPITPAPDPERIARILEGAAKKAETDVVWHPSDERAVEQARRAATYRRFAAALREVETRKARHG
ncbi:hypothetical protein [Methylobacterium sp. B1]|uniref:hypothetical protein n=1 Tax=Methylobacterium sp. B1 TaxID=91459 RepID=UPI00034928C1|nr:hypothetical protein [Methylobacterium sp. B1]